MPTKTMPLCLCPQAITRILLLIFILYPLVGMGVDLISPSLPAMSQDLHISQGYTKNFISIYLLGFALGNFTIGFLSDSLGRRYLLLGGLTAFVLSSLLPTVFQNASVLLLTRFLQGFTIAAFAVLARAIISDILPQERLASVMPIIATMWGIGPIIGPMIGGYLQFYFNWQACFYFFAGLGLIGVMAMAWILPETHFKRQPLNIRQISLNLASIATHRVFMGVVLLMGSSYSLLIVFNTLGPFLIQSGLGYSPLFFGRVALSMGIVFLLATIVCRRCLRQYSPEAMFRFLLPIAMIIAVLGVLAAYLDHRHLFVILLPSYLMFFTCGLLYPSGMLKGVSLFRHLVGSASAMMNLINVLITSLAALCMSFVNASTALPLAWMYFLLIFISTVSYWFWIRKK